MAYGRRLKPRIYPCTIQHLMHRGETSVVSQVIGSGYVDVSSGSHYLRAFDGQPSVRASFDTSTALAGDDVVFEIDIKDNTRTIDYVALLNHNLSGSGANAVFSIWGSNSSVTWSSGTVIATSEFVGAATDYTSATAKQFQEDGSHIILFDSSQNYRYYYIVFQSKPPYNWTGDLEIGDIMLGKHCTAPHGPDIGMKTGILHDGGKVLESFGGTRHHVAGWTTGSDGQSLPFGVPFKTNNITVSENAAVQPGRRYWEFTLSYLADTVVSPSDLSTGVVNPTTFTNVYALTAGPALPFIFTPDSTSTTVGDYAFARFADDDYQFEEVAFGVVNISRRIEEEF